jgi:hypothetical protein
VRIRTAAAIVAVIAIAGSGCRREAREADEGGLSRTERRIDEQLTPATEIAQRDGLAAAILIDVSGSMDDEVRSAGGRERKIGSPAARPAISSSSLPGTPTITRTRPCCSGSTSSASAAASPTAAR